MMTGAGLVTMTVSADPDQVVISSSAPRLVIYWELAQLNPVTRVSHPRHDLLHSSSSSNHPLFRPSTGEEQEKSRSDF